MNVMKKFLIGLLSCIMMGATVFGVAACSDDEEKSTSIQNGGVTSSVPITSGHETSMPESMENESSIVGSAEIESSVESGGDNTSEMDSSSEQSSADAHIHAWNDGKVMVKPTCEENGYTETKCSVCDFSVTSDMTEAHGHSYASQEKDGYVLYTCHCGDSYSEKTGPSYTNVTSVSNGNDYVITVTSDGVTYALSHGNNTVSAVQVTVSGDEITSEITENMVWRCADNKLSYVSAGTTYYLYTYNSGNWWWTSPALGISSTQSSDASMDNQRLKLGSYYLNYSNNTFGANSNGSTVNIFLES